jgi:GT2 family glycosyltransferase
VKVAPVAVAISTLDRPDALARCLESLARGTEVPAEVVVVDQSDDRTAEAVVASATGRLAGVRHIAGTERGLARGQNESVRAGTQPLVAVLDDDCVASPDWIATVARTLVDVDVVAGRVLPLEGAPGLEPVSSRTSTVRREFRWRAIPWDVGSGNNFALRREWFERIGGCDERLGPGSPARGGVDMDLFYRLVRAGAVTRYEPDLVVYHERKPRSERLARRGAYGHGMAAACGIWLRSGDRYAWRVLAAWLGLRSRLLASALRHRRWVAAWEEVLVLGGTGRGLVHGLRAARS